MHHLQMAPSRKWWRETIESSGRQWRQAGDVVKSQAGTWDLVLMRLRVGQRIPDPREATIPEVLCVEGGKFGDSPWIATGLGHGARYPDPTSDFLS